MLRVGIAGGSGYGGVELISILLRHSQAELVFVSSEQYAGKEVADLYPHLLNLVKLRFSKLEEICTEELDLLFLALPHGQAMKILPTLPDGLSVIDLSGDFRINDPAEFEEYYGFPQSEPELQAKFVYGLPEVNREKIRSATHISNPGCFATTTVLALYPLYREGWIDGPVYVDSKTGSSGSGRTPSDKTHHPRRSQSLFPYKPFRHQHIPEMRQVLNRAENRLVFQPHSAPFVRGIFASHYMQLKQVRSNEEVTQLFCDYYGNEPFIRWLSHCPDVAAIQHSNYVDISARTEDGHLIVWSTLDNLQKGAAGQAVQNMNISCGLQETESISLSPAFP